MCSWPEQSLPPGATRRGIDVAAPISPEDVIGYLRAGEITLIYDPRTRTLQADTPEAVAAVIDLAS
jgi:hypothetical protein